MLLSTKIDGIECEYSTFDSVQKDVLKTLCKKYNKYMSGGSDYHADFKPNVNMGTGINNNLNIYKDFIGNWLDNVLMI